MTSNAISFIFGIAALGIAQLLLWLKMRPRRLHMRDYYDAYYGHCSRCEMESEP